jgi:methylisocitrate lyase
MKKTTIFKNLVLDRKILVLPGAHDAMSAKIVEQTGFKAVTLGGYPASASILGQPDVSLLTLTEMATLSRNVVEAVDIPVFSDGDTGHGNVTNVIRTVRELEKAGVAGLFIEDQVFPKRCGHMEGKQVVEQAEMIAKIKAAVDTRIDQDLIIMARTDARAIYGIEEAISRANCYREAGADLIFIEAPLGEEELRRINLEVNAPTMANMVEGGKTPLYAAQELEDMGFAVVVFPLSSIYATAFTVRRLMEELYRTGTTRGYLEHMIAFDDFNRLIGLENVRETEALYYKDLIDLSKK